MSNDASLERLADALGIDAAYASWTGVPARASDATLRAVIAALAPELDLSTGADAAATALAVARWRRVLEPVLVAWCDGEAGEGGGELQLPLRVPADVDGDVEATLALEGDVVAGSPTRARLFELPAHGHAWPGGQVHCVRTLIVRVPAPGYHRVAVTCLGARHEAMVIASPRRAFAPPRPPGLGLLAPVYALRGPGSGATGDLATLRELAGLAAARGVSFLGILPILAGLFDEPHEPSPYSAVSRVAWNELYLDVAAAAARLGVAAPAMAATAPPAEPLIDYRAQYRWRRRALDELAQVAWADPARAATLRAFADGVVGPYALFRALVEERRASWASWDEPTRAMVRDPVAWRAVLDGRAGGDALGAGVRAHIYAQHELEAQLAALPRDTGLGLYVDLPVGVGGDAFDVLRQPELFVTGASTGAPPDALFVGGQDWGLPPLHPERARQDEHRYLIASVRHHMRHAAMLRVDHVMGLHRLYWVPRGRPATDGAYVRYAADEAWAILCLESHRQRCEVIGEDLGTVPPSVPAAMAAHGVRGLHVRQFALPARLGAASGAIPAACVASLGTHDTPTFAGCAAGDDLVILAELGLLSPAQRTAAATARATSLRAVAAELRAQGWLRPDDDPADPGALMRALHCQLAASPARDVLITLEDLWLERAPQNVPGTGPERPNWRRPLARALPAIAAALDEVAELVALRPTGAPPAP
jgi:4-alpha-glucanotransferase